MTDTLTLDALQKDVGQAICRERRNCHPHPCDTDANGACLPHACVGHIIYDAEARTALAAVAKRMGDPDRLRGAAFCLAADASVARKTGPTLAAALDDCATLLRTLAEAAP